LEASSLLREVREYLAPLNERILRHRYITDAEEGMLKPDQIRAFVSNQYYIVSYDIKSLGLMLARSSTGKEADFFKNVLDGDMEGLSRLVKLAQALGLSAEEMAGYSAIPGAVAYTHYLVTLASFAQPGEQAMALIVNLPVWGANCVRLSRALRAKYRIDETGFLEIFTSPMEEAEKSASEVIEDYLPQRREHMKRAAALVQAYELMFWDGIYTFKGG